MLPSPDDQRIVRAKRSWQGRYWLVVLLVAASYAACAAQTTPHASQLSLLIQLLTIAVTLQVADVPEQFRRLGWVVVGTMAVAAFLAALLGLSGRGIDIVLASLSVVAYASAAAIIILDQLRQCIFDRRALWAVIAAYVMVGMAFTFAFNLIALLSDIPTFGAGQVDSLSGQLFFSFTTLTTTGYGNVVPVSPAVQSLAIVEAITGQLFLVIAVARIVTVSQRARTP